MSVNPVSDSFSFSFASLGCVCSKSDFIVYQQNGQQNKKQFRKDYHFMAETQSFYKFHTIRKSWLDAKKTCSLEGATLFYPEDKTEADAVIVFWDTKQTHLNRIFIGVSSQFAKGLYYTVDGVSLTDVYNNWAPGEPNNDGGVEDCALLVKDTGHLEDNPCWWQHPFISKKTLASLKWNEKCDMPNTDYVYNEMLRTCYKIHLTPNNWTEAYTVFSAEQSHLAVINSQAEADYLVGITEKAPKDKVRGKHTSGVVLLGFHNLNNDGWTTLKGTSVEDSGYSIWRSDQSDSVINGADDTDQCGSMFYNGRLNAVGCQKKCIFICEHEVKSDLDDGLGE